MHNPGELKMIRTLLLITLLLQISGVAAQAGRVRIALSAPSVSIDESVTLTVTATGIDAELDLSMLDKDFEVLGRSSSRQVKILNGKRSSSVTWAIELNPRSVGVWTIPPVRVGKLESQSLTLSVTDNPVGAARQLFVEASVDTDTPYVQSQVIFSVRVFQAINIVDGSLGGPAGSAVVVERLGEDTGSRAVRDGREYQVLERRFAVFPQQSGEITIEPITLNASVPADAKRVQGFFSPTRKLTRRRAARMKSV